MKLQYIAAIGALFLASSAYADCAKDCPEGGCKKDQTVFAARETVEVQAPEEEKDKQDPPKGPT